MCNKNQRSRSELTKDPTKTEQKTTEKTWHNARAVWQMIGWKDNGSRVGLRCRASEPGEKHIGVRST